MEEPSQGASSQAPSTAESRAAARLPWLLGGWALSSVLLIAAVLLLLLTDATTVGMVLFVLGAIGTLVVSFGLLRARAAVRQANSS